MSPKRGYIKVMALGAVSTEPHVARWLSCLHCLHCCLTARRSWVGFPHGALLALGGRSSPECTVLKWAISQGSLRKDSPGWEKAENKFTATSGLPACVCVCVSCVRSA